MGKNSILFPKRYSAVTHGHFAVGPQGMYFKFDHCLSPTSVYGAMLRLEQVNWLDKFKHIVCESEQDMWDLRRRLPGKADIVDQLNVHDAEILSYTLVVTNKNAWWWIGNSDESDEYIVEGVAFVEIDALWPVTTPTADYRRVDDGRLLVRKRHV